MNCSTCNARLILKSSQELGVCNTCRVFAFAIPSESEPTRGEMNYEKDLLQDATERMENGTFGSYHTW